MSVITVPSRSVFTLSFDVSHISCLLVCHLTLLVIVNVYYIVHVLPVDTCQL